MRGWLRLASHLHMALQECQDKHTSTEFLIWNAYLDELELRHTKEHYYFAQLAYEIRIANQNLKDPGKDATIKSKLLDFTAKVKEDDEEQVGVLVDTEDMTEEEVKQLKKRRADVAKSVFGAMLGIDLQTGEKTNGGTDARTRNTHRKDSAGHGKRDPGVQQGSQRRRLPPKATPDKA